jgi:hypothetical protein
MILSLGLQYPIKLKNMKKLIIILSLASLFGTSCKKDIVDRYESKKTTTPAVNKTRDLTVASNFDWSTTNEVSFELTPKTSGLLLIQSVDAEVFYKAFLKPGVKHTAKLTLQNKHEKMYFYFNGNQEEVVVKPGMMVASKLN